MTRKVLLASMLVLCVAVSRAATETWDQANNWISYSDTVTDSNMGSAGVNVDLNQFNAAYVEAQEGNVTLSSIVIKIDGAFSGTAYADNENDTAVTDVTITMTPSSKATLSSGTFTVSEGYSASQLFETLGADSDGGLPDFVGSDSASASVNSSGNGPQSQQYSSGLSSFIGTGNVTWLVNYEVAFESSGTGNVATFTQGSGTAVVTITYYYEPVPEPTSLALVGVGGLVLALRRRFGRKA